MHIVIQNFLNKPDGTYDRKTARRKVYHDGYCVSFHQNAADAAGHYKSHTGFYHSITAYRKLIERTARRYGLTVNVGVFHHEIEVSFWTPDIQIAQQIAQRFNQYSFYDCQQQREILNPFYDPTQNPMVGK